MAHDEHHYIPKFLLEAWHGVPDDKLTVFKRAGGRVVADRLKARSVAKQRHLYATGIHEGQPDNSIERDYMAKTIDDPAAPIHKALLQANGAKIVVPKLSPQQRIVWARFVVAQWLRVPAMIEILRDIAKAHLTKDDEPLPPELFADGVSPQSLSELTEQFYPDTYRDIGRKALPGVFEAPLLNDTVLKATWLIRDLSDARDDMLISDTPLVYEGQMASTFLLSFPLSPTRAFFASSDPYTAVNLIGIADDEYVRQQNCAQINLAAEFVYAANDRHRKLVEQLLRR